jgi:glycosyltransferase involved in cell wall biosynthesis
MKKIMVFILSEINTGINKYRLLDPTLKMQNLYPEDFFVDFVKIDDVKKYAENPNSLNSDVIFFPVTLVQNDMFNSFLYMAKARGVKIVCDVDDYWVFHKEHNYYKQAKQINMEEKIIRGIKISDAVITTNDFLLSKIKSLNKNVIIIPNSIDFTEPQFQINNIDSDFVRIGYVTGSSHYIDSKILRGCYSTVTYKHKNAQFHLCGFNVKDGKGENTAWHLMEQEFTDNYRNFDPEYFEHLMEFKNVPYVDKNKNYRRRWTKSIHSYMEHYNELDITLAPLKDMDFNKSKSNLKMLEGGVKKKAMVVSDISTYSNLAVHEKTALVVSKNKEHKNWVKFINRLIEESNLRQDLGEALYEKIYENFNLNETIKTRKDFFKNI